LFYYIDISLSIGGADGSGFLFFLRPLKEEMRSFVINKLKGTALPMEKENKKEFEKNVDKKSNFFSP